MTEEHIYKRASELLDAERSARMAIRCVNDINEEKERPFFSHMIYKDKANVLFDSAELPADLQEEFNRRLEDFFISFRAEITSKLKQLAYSTIEIKE